METPKLSPEDVDAYLQRIGCTEYRKPCLENLSKIQLAHVQEIPFENMNLHLCAQRPIVVDNFDVLKRKVLGEKRGGYCFELNQMFNSLLNALGYDVVPPLARIRWEVPENVVTGLTHLINLVKLDGKTWLVDVGAGMIGSSQPLDIDSEEPVVTLYNTYRIARVGENERELQILDSHDVWRPSYRFMPILRSYPIDWTIGSNWVSTQPDSLFCCNIFCAIYTATEKVYLVGSELTRRDGSGIIEKRTVTSKDEYTALLKDVFKLPMEELGDYRFPATQQSAPVTPPCV